MTLSLTVRILEWLVPVLFVILGVSISLVGGAVMAIRGEVLLGALVAVSGVLIVMVSRALVPVLESYGRPSS